MNPMPPAAPAIARTRDPRFQTTSWSLVQEAVGSDPETAHRALESLCDAYWYPIYAWFRAQGHGGHDAEDLTQGFFATEILSREALARAAPEKGRLRSYLLGCARRFAIDEWKRSQAQKRQPAALASFDAGWAEEHFATEPVDEMSPDRLYQRAWAQSVLEEALRIVESEYQRKKRAGDFAVLRPFIAFGPELPGVTYEEAAQRLGRPVPALHVEVSRLRQRWRQIVFREVARTLDEPTEANIKAELAELISSF